jgi:hypothetical protein
MAVALLALLIACSGAAFAAGGFTASDGTITACRDNKTGVLRVIDAATQTCGSKEIKIWWKDGINGKVADSSHADSATSAGDANTLDGKDSTQFANSSHTHSGADITSGTVEADRIEDGQGSNLNADQLDGLDSIQLPHGFYQVDQTFIQASPANGFAAGIVRCDEGDKVVGGGYGDLHPTSKIASDAPIQDAAHEGTRSGWVIAWKTLDPNTTDDIAVSALCADFGETHNN